MKTCSWASRQVAIRIETSKDEDTPDLPMSSGSTRLAGDFTGLGVFGMLTMAVQLQISTIFMRFE